MDIVDQAHENELRRTITPPRATGRDLAWNEACRARAAVQGPDKPGGSTWNPCFASALQGAYAAHAAGADPYPSALAAAKAGRRTFE